MSAAEQLPADPVAEALGALRDAWVCERRAGRFSRSTAPRDYCYLSQIRDCYRRMALDLTNPEDEPEFDDETIERMARGDERERDVLAFLTRAARRSTIPFKVVENQVRLEIHDRDGVLLGVGRIDARIRFENGVDLVGDVKSSKFADQITHWRDMDRSRWTRHWPDQVLLYAFEKNLAHGAVILDHPGVPKFVPVPLLPNLDRVERDMQKMRAAVDYRFGRGPLPPATEDRSECDRCPHALKSCTAPLENMAGARVFDDERLVALALAHERTAAAALEHDDAHDELSAALRGVENGILGPFRVTGRWSRRGDNPQHSWRMSLIRVREGE